MAGLDFTALVREHQAMVFSIAYHYLHDRATAEEVAQDVFLQLYRCLGALESPAHAANWLRRVASHRSMDYSRRNARRQVSLEQVREPATAPEIRDPLLGERLRQLVASLPPKARAIVVLRFQEELAPEEIAAVLQIPLGTVKSQLQRSLAMLREKIGRAMGVVR